MQMHVPEPGNMNGTESGYYLAYHQYGTSGRRVRPPPTVTDLPLDDAFDAATTLSRDSQVYRMWEDDTGSAYDAVDYARRQNTFRNVPNVRARRNSESLLINTKKDYLNGSRPVENPSERGGTRRGKTAGVSGRNELVEHRVLEDGPTRTISVWREEVAESSEESPELPEMEQPRKPNGHRRTVSGNLSHSSGSVISRDSRSKDVVSSARRSLERTIPRSPLRTQAAVDASTPIMQPSPLQYEQGRSSPMPTASPTVVTAKFPIIRGASPSISRSGTPTRGICAPVISKTDSASTLELLLSSCRPSLVHLAPTFEDLGIRKEEHLRAIAKMNEDIRDREVRDVAVRSGVTAIEWAILLDKLKSLYSYDDMYI